MGKGKARIGMTDAVEPEKSDAVETVDSLGGSEDGEADNSIPDPNHTAEMGEYE